VVWRAECNQQRNRRSKFFQPVRATLRFAFTMKRGNVIVRPMPVMKKLFALGLLFIATPAWSQPVPGSLDVHWNEGAPDCTTTPQDPLQVHTYEPQTFILRQSPCASFEANFLYLLVGSDKALLIDTGAVADPKKMPLAKTILELLPDKDHQKLPLLVAHTHRHLDHRAGDPQFASLPSVQVVPIDLEGVRAFFGFTNWPNGIAHLDLGDRTVDIIPTPGTRRTWHSTTTERGFFFREISSWRVDC
jgi:hydroxyacylglutathione hydrolase